MGFRLAPKSVTLNDLERRNGPYCALFHRWLGRTYLDVHSYLLFTMQCVQSWVHQAWTCNSRCWVSCDTNHRVSCKILSLCRSHQTNARPREYNSSPTVCRIVYHESLLSLFWTVVLGEGGVNRITYWSQGVASLPHKCQPPSPPLNNIRVMVIVWRLRGNIIRTAPCWVVWHSVHSQQHTYMSSSYRPSRLGLSHWPCIEAVA